MTTTYVLAKDSLGYDAGEKLRDVTLREARNMECNRCGDCCNGLSPHVKKDEATGLPMFVWGSKFPEDLYEERFGQRLLMPIVMGDGGPRLGADFEIDADGKPYSAFRCSFWEPGEPSSCGLYGKDKDPNDISTIRPRNCGDFPVFGSAIDDALIGGHSYVVPTGALPRCTWYGLRIVGPWRDTPYWRERWNKQQAGEPVDDLSLPPDFIEAVAAKTAARRVTKDGSARRGD